MHTLQKDAYLVFRSMCKLSTKNEIKSKVLSLEILLEIVKAGGVAFHSSDIFISGIKHHLCVSLTQNMMFKVHLKPQIEVFFQYILLHILEAKSSSLQHKIQVLEALTWICQNPQTVVGLYVNYDCDWKARNLFQSLVYNLNIVAWGGHLGEVSVIPETV
ncbi:hypothetical protein Pcinc_003021 [Petrolisthes cinctipes]|uniref:Mon2/Sec7/BIG1-like HUS domain-containing protein n=1 Tax=Petrolisthes cinctipes TaxID=88211 RepID=A0AAE1L1K0_PETCI|nr:hypothetical protein Pcinc_003021 [Petrolisthes cinctipes]